MPSGSRATSYERELPTYVRRSPRLLRQNGSAGDRRTEFAALDSKKGSSRNRPNNSRKVKKVSGSLRECATQGDGCRRSARLNGAARDSLRECARGDGLRRSPRLNGTVQESFSFQRSLGVSNWQNTVREVKSIKHKSTRETGDLLKSRKCIKEAVKDAVENEVIVNRCPQFMAKGERNGRQCVLGLAALKEEERDESKMPRKRKRCEVGHGNCQGWTKEQEAALQRAYFSAKPTPHFWKKVSKLVPGKSAQECFDKIHSDHLTPTQPRLRSRTKKQDTSSIEHFSLSASKILKTTTPLIKRPSCKRKSHLAQKTVRQLLEKQNRVDQNYEADLFSVLEPNVDPSSKELTSVLSTPDNLQKLQVSLQSCSERSSSGRKRPPSRLCSSSRTRLMSPPVLKPVKNRVLHEKYLDQLHSREARRNFTPHVKGSFGEANKIDANDKKLGVVRAATHALLSNVKDAIDQLQHLKGMSNAADFDEDVVHRQDDYDDDDDGCYG